jgi:polysaccharide export outer membrane protein
MAGGLTNVADTRITIKHRTGNEENVTVKLKNDDPHTSLLNDVQVFPGDLVLVPRAGIVYVLGDVNKPGGFVMQDNGKMTLLQALAQAGGASQTASLNRAVLLRKTDSGYVTNKLQVGKISRGQGADIELHANDIVFLPNNRLKNALKETQSMAQTIGSASIYAIVH